MMAGSESDLEQVLPQAQVIFGDRLTLAERFARKLATDGIVRGLMGPREVPRLWERHLLNSAVIAELLPQQARVVDVGTGAGLPGVALACRRPDLRVDLVESLERRVTFLTETVQELGLSDTVRVIHGRVESPAVRSQVGNADWVTARALAPLDRLVKWCLPLLVPGGSLLALKGESAASELAAQRKAILAAGGTAARLVQCGAGELSRPVTVVIVERSEPDKRRRSTRDRSHR